MSKGFVKIKINGMYPLYDIAWSYNYIVDKSMKELHVLMWGENTVDTVDRMFNAVKVCANLSYDKPIIVHNITKPMPNNPHEDSLYWAKWQAEIYATVGVFEPDDIVFSSETDGYPLSIVLGCRYVAIGSVGSNGST